MSIAIKVAELRGVVRAPAMPIFDQMPEGCSQFEHHQLGVIEQRLPVRGPGRVGKAERSTQRHAQRRPRHLRSTQLNCPVDSTRH